MEISSRIIVPPLNVLCFEPLPIRITLKSLKPLSGSLLSKLSSLVKEGNRAILTEKGDIEEFGSIFLQALKNKELAIDELGPGGLGIRIMLNLLDNLGQDALHAFIMSPCGDKVYDFIENLPYYHSSSPRKMIENYLSNIGITGIIEEFNGYAEQLFTIEHYDYHDSLTSKQFIGLRPQNCRFSQDFLSQSIDFIRKNIDIVIFNDFSFENENLKDSTMRILQSVRSSERKIVSSLIITHPNTAGKFRDGGEFARIMGFFDFILVHEEILKIIPPSPDCASDAIVSHEHIDFPQIRDDVKKIFLTIDAHDKIIGTAFRGDDDNPYTSLKKGTSLYIARSNFRLPDYSTIGNYLISFFTYFLGNHTFSGSNERKDSRHESGCFYSNVVKSAYQAKKAVISPRGVAPEADFIVNELRLFARLKTELNSCETAEDVFRVVLREVLEFMRCDGCLFLLAGEIEKAYHITRNEPEPLEIPDYGVLDNSLCRWVIEHRMSLAVFGLKGNAYFQNKWEVAGFLQGYAIIAEPLIVDSQVAGVIEFIYHEGNRGFNAHMEQVACNIASDTSAAIYKILSTEKLRQLSIIDSLTGLYNSRFLKQKLSDDIFYCEKMAQPLSFLLADIDFFKYFNDIYGHSFGDFVLISVANALRSVASQNETPARYGGEEFAIILPSREVLQAKSQVGENLRANVASLNVSEMLDEYIDSQKKRLRQSISTLREGTIIYRDLRIEKNIIDKLDQELKYLESEISDLDSFLELHRRDSLLLSLKAARMTEVINDIVGAFPELIDKKHFDNLPTLVSREVEIIKRVDLEEYIRNRSALSPEEQELVLRSKDKHRRKLTVSIGIAGYRSNLGVDHLFAAADRALYKAKMEGRNRVEINE